MEPQYAEEKGGNRSVVTTELRLFGRALAPVPWSLHQTFPIDKRLDIGLPNCPGPTPGRDDRRKSGATTTDGTRNIQRRTSLAVSRSLCDFRKKFECLHLPL